MSRRRRAPSTRFPTLVADGERAYSSRGQWEPCTDPAAIGPAARSQVDEECVVWVHDTVPWKADEVGGRAVGGGGWVILDGEPKVHVALARQLDQFVGTEDVFALGRAVEHWRRHLGIAYLFSGASTIHKLIATTGRVPEQTDPPVFDVPYQATAWAVPSNSWAPVGVLEVCAAFGRRWVRAFDRSGSYLSAWRGAALPAGTWTKVGRCKAIPGPESAKPAGYWLVDRGRLPEWPGLFDPWRRHTDPEGPIWLTTPLVQLAVDLTDEPLVARAGWWAADRCRSIDAAAERIAGARHLLAANEDAAAAVTLAALKEAYAGATAWFEYGPQHPDPLARPSWRHTILDRYVANTWRALSQAIPGPFALTEIDAALFALNEPDEFPLGLRTEGLGAWKPKGEPVPIHMGLTTHRDPHSLIAQAEGAT